MEANQTPIKTFSNGCKLVIANEVHAIKLAPQLRPYDMLECRACGMEPFEALMYALEHDDETYTVLLPDDTPIAMFGVGKAVPLNEAYIWLLGSNGIERVGLQFLRECRALVQWLVEPYGEALNYVAADYSKSVRWLKWMGAEFLDIVHLRGVAFIQFKLTAV